ncbi:MAG: cupredoxin domain-containing protein [Armatimonadota bacterium]|nr:cupredoxin domain-containing protein [Armatimonadota bacterium]MDR7426545.1 cupredoxin domain-containing protein [Armatimonadota bacterium]MDR7464250.1 cupredoxin domain-containing protein [Armatimonadota bacterium]MDR7474523.1 cupredoxin domain-containing protein [Armatimonadota bacterium]MDR7540102.1 cupredoxin domain-containing protein [Armatimonadota bacterium]
MRVVLVLLVMAGLTLGATAAPKAQKMTVTMSDYRFTPSKVNLTAGTPAALTLVNKGKVEHEFMVYLAPKTPPEDWDEYVMSNTFFKDMGEVEVEFEGQGAVAGVSIFEVEVKPGKRAVVHFTPSRKGTFEIGCHVEGHYEAGMRGTLTVK